jgi:hypothetical protein
MKFFQIILYFILFPLSLFSQEIRSEEYILTTKDAQFDTIKKQITWYDSSSNIVKIEIYWAPQYEKESGYLKQINYYKNGIPYLFEMYTSEEGKNETGFIIRRDFVNEKDEMLKVEVILTDNSTWVIEKDYFTILKRFPFKKNDFYYQIFSENIQEDVDYSQEAPIFTGMSHFSIDDKLNKININNQICLKLWLQSHSIEDFSSQYIFQTILKINGKPCILLLTKGQSNITSFKDVLIYYHYIGGIKKIPIFVCAGFIVK